MEITEDAEENGTGREDPQAQSPVSNQDTRKSSISEATAVPPRRAHTDADGSSIADHMSRPSTRDCVDSPSDRRPSAQWDSYEPRMSSQSTRPSLRELDHSSFTRQKVKLGPRPAVDVNGRPRTAGSLSRSQDQRPVAALPAGIKLSTPRKPSPTTSRPKSQPSSPPSTHSSTTAPPVPPLLVPPPSLSFARPQSSPSAKSVNSNAPPGITPEKQRLMKALELRKKQMEKRAEEEQRKEHMNGQKSNTVLDADEDKANIDTVHGTQMEGQGQQHTESDSEQIGSLPFESEAVALEAHHDHQPSSDSSKPDSAVDLMAVDSDSTQHSKSSTPAASDTSRTTSDESQEDTQRPTPQADRKGGSEVSVQHQAAETPKLSDIGAGPSETTPQKPDGGVTVPPITVESVTSNEKEESAPTLAPETVPLPETPRSARSSSAATSSASEASGENDEGTAPKGKRKPLLEPIRVVPGQDFSDEDNLLSDDSFMEELKSATVQEAKPVSVGKSPVSPVPPSSRVVSNPTVGGQAGDVQALPVGRSASSPYFDNSNRPVPVLVAKKVNVSSGISKRIKALEKFSNSRETSSSASHNLTVPTPSHNPFEKFRKRASQIAAPSNTPSPEATSKAPTPDRSDSLARRPNSVSVTARIIRDPNAPPSDPKADPSEPSALNLQRSPLIVEHNSPETPSEPPASTDVKSEEPEERSTSVSSAGSRRNSLAAATPNSESKPSTSSHSKADGVTSRSTSDLTSSPEEKKESRTSRIIRRMSSITSSSKKSVLSAFSSAVKEEEAPPPPPEKEEEQARELPQAVDIGEVNVQFPDTLLWKRRFLRIDEQGYLVLRPGNVDSSTRNLIKRYHLSEFKTPCLPDQDRQELPHSIVLDFRDGNTLQCACESRQGQAAVLQSKHILPSPPPPFLLESQDKLTINSAFDCPQCLPTPLFSIATFMV